MTPVKTLSRGRASPRGCGERVLLGLVYVWLNLPTDGVAYCSVATIYGLNTADCNNRSLETVPMTLRDDVKVLKFNDNLMTTVANDAFRPYPMLREVYLARNRIQTVAAEAFRGLYQLQVLDLEDNVLSEVPTDCFHNLQSLRVLRMGGNPIGRVTSESLRSLRAIEELGLQNCRIASFDPKALVDLHRLTQLDLTNNDLGGFEGSSAAALDWFPVSLIVFRLHRNPWTCDCRLRWLRKRVETTWDSSSSSPTCSAPDLLRGISWRQLAPDQFACPSQIIASGPTAIEIKPGANVTVECLVAGDPEPTVRWTKESKTLDRGRTARNYLWTLSNEQRILSSLFITDASPSHAGHYKCIAENSAGRSEATYRLRLTVTDATNARRNLVVLSPGQRAMVAVCVGLIGVLLAVVLVVGCLVSLRQRWINAYKVTDSIAAQSTVYSSGGGGEAIAGGCCCCGGGKSPPLRAPQPPPPPPPSTGEQRPTKRPLMKVADDDGKRRTGVADQNETRENEDEAAREASGQTTDIDQSRRQTKTTAEKRRVEIRVDDHRRRQGQTTTTAAVMDEGGAGTVSIDEADRRKSRNGIGFFVGRRGSSSDGAKDRKATEGERGKTIKTNTAQQKTFRTKICTAIPL